MKGIVFNLLEEVVRREQDDETWDAVLREAHLEGVYASIGGYPDDHLTRLVDAASTLLGDSPDEVVRWFGRCALPLLAHRYPEFFGPPTSTLPFLRTLNDIIHPEVRKVYPGADVPVFDFEALAPNVLRMGYRSRRKLCSFGEGLIEGAADYYREAVAIEHPRCQKRGDDKCVFEVSIVA